MKGYTTAGVVLCELFFCSVGGVACIGQRDSRKGKNMITVNGKKKEFPGNITIREFLALEQQKDGYVAVELNETIIPREEYGNRSIKDWDRIEIVSFMGGGSVNEPEGSFTQASNTEEERTTESEDAFTLGGHKFSSRFILGSGKYSLDLIDAAVKHAGAEIITLALRRANEGGMANILDYIPKGVTLLPNTSGARNAEEAVRIARLSREICRSDFVKIEVIRDSKYLLPDNYETLKAVEILAKEGFVVMPYMYPDLNAARDMANAGAACIMPLGAPIGSNKGICTKEFIQILIDEIDLPVIVDAGIGRPSQACEAMEMGAAAVMANTAIATAGDIPAMAEAFRMAITAGRKAYLSGLGRVMERGASASSPLTGFLQDGGEDA